METKQRRGTDDYQLGQVHESYERKNKTIPCDKNFCPIDEFTATLEEYKHLTHTLGEECNNLRERIDDLHIQTRDVNCACTAHTESSITTTNGPKKKSKLPRQRKNTIACATCLRFRGKIEAMSEEIAKMNKVELNLRDSVSPLRVQLDEQHRELELLKKSYQNDKEEMKKTVNRVIELERENDMLNKRSKEADIKRREATSRAMQLANENEELKRLVNDSSNNGGNKRSTRLVNDNENVSDLRMKLNDALSQLEKYKTKLEANAQDIASKNNKIDAIKQTVEELKMTDKNERLLKNPNKSNTIIIEKGLDSHCENYDCDSNIGLELHELLEKERTYYEGQIKGIKMQLEKQKQKTSNLNERTIISDTGDWQNLRPRRTSKATDIIQKLRNDLKTMKDNLAASEKQICEMKSINSALNKDRTTLENCLKTIEKDCDDLTTDIDKQIEKVSSLERQLQNKETKIESMVKKITELGAKLESVNKERITLQHKCSDILTHNKALSSENNKIQTHFENALAENKKLQSDLAATIKDKNLLAKNYETSSGAVKSIKMQLRERNENSAKVESTLTAERTHLLDRIAELEHQVDALKNGGNDTAQNLKRKLSSVESLVEKRDDKIASMIHRISALETEVDRRQMIIENTERMLAHSREMCEMIEDQKRSILMGIGLHSSPSSSSPSKIECLEALLSESRHEAVSLKGELHKALRDNERLKERVKECRREVFK